MHRSGQVKLVILAQLSRKLAATADSACARRSAVGDIHRIGQTFELQGAVEKIIWVGGKWRRHFRREYKVSGVELPSQIECCHSSLPRRAVLNARSAPRP